MEDLQAQLPQALIPNLKMDTSYKMDEGYSEAPRSQDDPDSPSVMEQDGENLLLHPQAMTSAGISTAVSALSEAEKAGMSVQDWCPWVDIYHADQYRICVQHSTFIESLINF